MARAKKKLTKEQQEEDVKALQERKERDAKMNYQYSPCGYCGNTVRWRKTKAQPEAPKHCGKQDCRKKFLEESRLKQ